MEKFTVVVSGISWSITLHITADNYDEAMDNAVDYLDKKGKDYYDVVSVFDGWIKDYVSDTKIVKKKKNLKNPEKSLDSVEVV
jgi:hypothetical protein